VTRHWEDIAAGERFTTGQLLISREEILAFAAEFDPQPYHLDAEAAEASIFGGLCASGWQVTALMMRLLSDSLHRAGVPVLGVTAVPRLRWKIPVFAGDSLAASITVSGRSPEAPLPGAGSIDVAVVVENGKGLPVIELESRLMVPRSGAQAP